MMNPEDSNMAANAICHAALMSQEAFRQAAHGYGTPSAIYRPRLFVDGDQWCALLGEDIQVGVCGFGKCPHDAMHAFDQAWYAPLPDNVQIEARPAFGASLSNAGLGSAKGEK